MMSASRTRRRRLNRARAEFWSLKYRFQQRQINKQLLEIPDVCYYVPNLRNEPGRRNASSSGRQCNVIGGRCTKETERNPCQIYRPKD